MKMINWHGWNGDGKPEQGRVVECITKKNGVSLLCTYWGGHHFSINGLVEGTLNEGKVKRWRYK